MCGFVTFVNFKSKNLEEDNFLKLKAIYKHRGPDDIRLEKNQNNLILFRRLKIIDLTKNANQPFSSDDSKVKLIFNGEIYNFLEIRKELLELKTKFKSKSDTEVILKSYLTWGVNFIKKLRGMFSIVIIDNRLKKVLFFRDHFGQKPLFYTFYKDGIILSSEIKDIIKFTKKFSINKKIVEKYLLRSWTDDNKQTFFKDIYSLEPASVGIFSKNLFKIEKYWNLDITQKKIYNKDEFSEIFNNTIKLHLRSDVPVAFALSGGIDSSSIVKTSLQFNLKKFKTFSIIPKFKNENNESDLINQFVKSNKINHQNFGFNLQKNDNILEDIISVQDEPLNNPTFIYQYLLRKKISESGFKVLLTGEGGDEVFGGYTRMYIPYLIEQFISKNKKVNDIVKKNIYFVTGENPDLILNRAKNYYKNYKKIKNDVEDIGVFDVLEIENKKDLKNNSFFNETKPNMKNYFKKFLLNHIYKRDLPAILRQDDRNSMSNSIENRTPMIDHKLVEYIFSLDSKIFIKDGVTKYILKDFMKYKLNKNQLFSKKIGRPGISENIIFSNYYDKFMDLLSTNKYQINLVDKNKIKNLLKKSKKNHNLKFNNTFFRILNVLIWKESLTTKI
jgi:asparagine synthase (glutamine-hydrolysing)